MKRSVQKMRNEFEGLLARMANEFTEPARRIAFLINNYDVIASVFQVNLYSNEMCIAWILS